MEVEQESIESLVFQALGEASMCWTETPTSVFDSTRCKEIGEQLVSKIKRRVYLETAIKGHMEALRPLLDEWSGKP